MWGLDIYHLDTTLIRSAMISGILATGFGIYIFWWVRKKLKKSDITQISVYLKLETSNISLIKERLDQIHKKVSKLTKLSIYILLFIALLIALTFLGTSLFFRFPLSLNLILFGNYSLILTTLLSWVFIAICINKSIGLVIKRVSEIESETIVESNSKLEGEYK
jgi:hypothetical protein